MTSSLSPFVWRGNEVEIGTFLINLLTNQLVPWI